MSDDLVVRGDLGSSDGWLDGLRKLGERAGFHAPLGATHSATFVEGGPQLLVMFADLAPMLGAEPPVLPFARDDGWSVLMFVAQRPDWFRNRAVYQFMDRLIDQDFFDDFGPVLFTGAGPGGYGAAAYSVACPGARALLFSPQATLDPRRTAWDHRFARARRLNFTNRYGYAPDMLDAARSATVIYDPREPEDAMHAELFRAPHIRLQPAPGIGRHPFATAQTIGIDTDLIGAAMEDLLDSATFDRLWRRRRLDAGYLKRLALHAIDLGHPDRAARICNHAIAEGHGGWFVRFASKEGVPALAAV